MARRIRTTLAPDPGSDTEAAVRGSWPLGTGDEFDGNSLNEATWSLTTDQVGQNQSENISVDDGVMTINSHGEDSGGLAVVPGPRLVRAACGDHCASGPTGCTSTAFAAA